MWEEGEQRRVRRGCENRIRERADKKRLVRFFGDRRVELEIGTEERIEEKRRRPSGEGEGSLILATATGFWKKEENAL